MIFYPTIKAGEQYLHVISNATLSTRDPITARDLVLQEEFGVKIEDLRHLMDDEWCKSHHMSLCRILGIYGDKTDLRIGSPDDR